MKIRHCYLSVVVLLCWLGLPAAPALSGDEARRPNILFAFADDWGRYASAYAAVDERPGVNAVIQTPNFDRVAREGVLFTRAFVTSPSCTPCRSSLLSGQYFFRTGLGAILQGARWDAAIPSFPLLLREAGYHIGQTYKVWTPGTPADAPFGARKHEYESAGRKFNQFSQHVTRAVAAGRSIDEAKQALYDEVRANFDAFLDDGAGKSFCYWFGPTNVHRKWIRGSGKKLWGLDPDALKGRMPAFLPDVAEVREDFVDYLGEAMAFDAALGVLFKRLEETGQLENTLVVVSGDHGAPGFPRGKTNLYDFGTAVPLAVRWPGRSRGGRVVRDFVNLMDLAPTFLEAAGEKPPAVMTGRSFVDVLESGKEGQVDAARSFVVTGRERHVGNARPGYLPYPQRALRENDFLYIRNFKPDRWPEGDPRHITVSEAPSERELTEFTRSTLLDMDAGPTKAWLVLHRNDAGKRGPHFYELAFAKRPEEELYDLRKDPDQIDNVARDSEYSGIRERMAKKLMTLLNDAGDPRVIGDGSTFDQPPYVSEDGLGGKPTPSSRKKK